VADWWKDSDLRWQAGNVKVEEAALSAAIREAGAKLGPWQAIRKDEILLAPSPGMIGKIGVFFQSRGLGEFGQGRSQRLGRIGAVLLMPSYLAVQSPVLQGEIREAQINARDIYLALSAAQARESWKEYHRAAQSSESLALSDADAINLLAVAYEIAL